MRHKLLLADDSVTIQRVIELTFADEDIDVIAVGDGELAIDRLKSDKPDIVLADVGMPERDGYEVSTFVKRTPEFAHIPVLLLTGAFEPIDEARARAAGCDGVLVKPFEPQLVIRRVKDLISGSRSANAPVGLLAAGPAPAVPSPPNPAGSVDAYFDRLDAAFSSRENQPAGATRGLAEELADWHPEDLDAANADARLPDLPPAPPVHRRTDAPVASAVSSSSVEVSLAEAFAALLAAEQGRVSSPSSLPPARPVVVDDVLIEQITKRVIERLAGDAVNETVANIAERLVREEIERIKSHAR
ncbi:MAG: response regulator [Vicinamibacterales bacterium]